MNKILILKINFFFTRSLSITYNKFYRKIKRIYALLVYLGPLLQSIAKPDKLVNTFSEQIFKCCYYNVPHYTKSHL